MRVYVGTSGYAYKEWKGVFYPEKAPSKDMLRLYSQKLRCVEINNTFHRMPKESVLLSWAEQVPEDFIFALKARQIITHFKRLRNVGSETEYFFRMASALGKRLGPVLFQFPESFALDYPLFRDFLDLIPQWATCAFAFRSPTWHTDGVLAGLRDKGFSLCLEDREERPVDKIISAAPWGYLRLRRLDYTNSALSQWAERIRAQNWESVYVFFEHEEKARGPLTAARLSELLG